MIWTRGIAVSLLAASLVVTAGSRGVLSGPNPDPAPGPDAGAIVLTDDDTGLAMFDAVDLLPGESAQRCIEIDYRGTELPAVVFLYGESGGTGLDEYLALTVEEGTGGTFADCAGFVPDSTPYSGTLAGFASAHPSPARGLPVWTVASSPQSRTFRFTATLIDDNDAQGLDATATFVWEVHGDE